MFVLPRRKTGYLLAQRCRLCHQLVLHIYLIGFSPVPRDSGRLGLAVHVDLFECRAGHRHRGAFARDALHNLAASE